MGKNRVGYKFDALRLSFKHMGLKTHFHATYRIFNEP